MSFRLLPNNIELNFLRFCRYAYAVSFTLLLISVIAIVLRGGIPLGVDFQGGSSVQFSLDKSVDAQQIRSILEQTELKDLIIQSLGDNNKEYILRFSDITSNPSKIIVEALHKNLPDVAVTIDLAETVGSKVSTDMKDKALEALYYSLLIISIYISGRFEARWAMPFIVAGVLLSLFLVLSFIGLPIIYIVLLLVIVTFFLFSISKLSFALGAILSLLHDLLLTCGLLIVCGVSFDLSIVAALLAILGYSLNDTIVVYDRIREHIQKEKEMNKAVLAQIINRSITSTLSRTLLTSITTLLVLCSLLLFGGSILFPFALAITIGVCIGTLSSVFIASPILLLFGVTIHKEEVIHIDENGVV